MKIDLRILILPAVPFTFLGFLRIFFFVAGVNPPNERLAVFSLAYGVIIGLIVTVILLVEDVEIGHITLFRKRDDEDRQ